jgi:hypothetical protein
MSKTSEKAIAKVRVWQEKYPERLRDHQLVATALRSGELKKEPCRVCGSQKSDAHHEDYNSSHTYQRRRIIIQPSWTKPR